MTFDSMPGIAQGSDNRHPRLRLGHILYSNCFPVHARLLDRPEPGDPVLFEGLPSTLNTMLDAGTVDVSPSSSIEYAFHPDRYSILPDLVIGARGPVRSIVFVADRSPDTLAGATVALPTASATSVVLLKILLRLKWDVDVSFRWFDQRTENPFAEEGSAAALFIGDVALQPDLHREYPIHLDLGAEWFQHTGLPFAFAVWQAASGEPRELRELHRILKESRDFGERERTALAQRYAPHFGMPADFLEAYWNDLRFDLDEEMIEGLEAFYRMAAEIGEIERAPALRWIDR